MFIAVVEIAEFLGIAALLQWKKHDQTETALMLRAKKPRKLPFIDKMIRPMVGNPTKLQRMTAKRAASVVRFAVNTEVFDMLLLMLANPKSKLRAKGSKVKEVGITL